MKIEMHFLLKLLFIRAGWKVLQSSEVPWSNFEEFECFPAARKILERFYGLNVKGNGIIRKGGACDIQINPELAFGLGGALHRLKLEAGHAYFPLGKAYHEHSFLLVDESGGVFLWGEPTPPLLIANSFESALLRLLLNLRFAKPK